ncbi:MAG: biotin-dependent carboxyltransferase family protein [Desulfobacteraceae bacterium]|nr:biotin-dependent carboxyltransferase family protein [Desulfobacteraceae bacterium]
MQVFKTIEPGAHTLVQDLGRFGYQQFGVPPCGMLDKDAGRIANLLAGNTGNQAVLEITFIGPTLEVLWDTDIAVTGADMGLTVNGRSAGNWRSLRVKKGDLLVFKQAARGCRSYLAVTGGIDVPEVMDSRSCYIGARIGGLEGRALKAGDIIQGFDAPPLGEARQLPGEFVPDYGHEIRLRAIPGPQDDYFDEGLERFFESAFTVSHQANRMGYRLTGPVIAQRSYMPASIISEPSLPGGVQVPPDGQPIVLLAEQTVGGYTKIATVISTDLAKLAQAVPGDNVRFVRVTLDEAHRAYRERSAFFKALAAMDLAAGGDDPAGLSQRLAQHLIQI